MYVKTLAKHIFRTVQKSGGLVLVCHSCYKQYVSFYHATACNATHGVSCHRVSVRLSVTSRSCTKVVKPRITQTMPYDSSETLVL